LVIRDNTGLHNIGYVQNAAPPSGVFGVVPLNSPVAARLQGKFSGSDHTVVATNALFPGPYYLGTTSTPPEDLPLTNVGDIAGAQVWSFDTNTKELTIAYPNPSGGSIPAVFFWDVFQNELVVVTDLYGYVAAAYESEPPNQQPVQVRVYFG